VTTDSRTSEIPAEAIEAGRDHIGARDLVEAVLTAAAPAIRAQDQARIEELEAHCRRLNEREWRIMAAFTKLTPEARVKELEALLRIEKKYVKEWGHANSRLACHLVNAEVERDAIKEAADALANEVAAFTNLTQAGRDEDGGGDLDEALTAYREASK